MRREQQSRETWERGVAWGEAQPAATITDEGLVLGAGTVLVRMSRDVDGTSCPDVEANHDRLVALLAVLTRGRVPAGFVEPLTKVSRDWARGEKALAALRLAILGLPRVESRDDAYRLHLADQALALGLTPEGLLKELGYSSAVSALLKKSLHPDQARQPAGQPNGGQFAPGAGSGGEPRPKGVQVALLDTKSDLQVGAEHKPTPEELFGVETIGETLSHGHPLPLAFSPIGGFPVPLPAAPGSNGGSDSPGGKTTEAREAKECKPAGPDTKRGPNARADGYELDVGDRVNPEDPTPPGFAYPMWSPKYRKFFNIDDCFKNHGDLVDGDMEKGDLAEAKGPGYEELLQRGWWWSLDESFDHEQSTVDGTNIHIKVYFAEKGAYDLVVNHYGDKYKNLVFAYMPPSRFIPQTRVKGKTRAKQL